MPTFFTGVKPVRKDHRDLSYARTFGATVNLPSEIDLDFLKSVPDQNADGLPYGCTGYTQTDLCADEDRILYEPQYTYDQTRIMECTLGLAVGCDVRNSLKSTIVYGVLPEGTADRSLAPSHRRGAYYNVIDSPDLDAFDDVRSALLTNKRTVSAATPWFDNWLDAPRSGVLPAPGRVISYHNWKICGWKLVAGQPHLIGKPWQGHQFGDKGYVYLSRAVFNVVMAMPGSACFTLRKAAPGDYARIKLTMLETLLSYYRMLLAKLLP